LIENKKQQRGKNIIRNRIKVGTRLTDLINSDEQTQEQERRRGNEIGYVHTIFPNTSIITHIDYSFVYTE